MIETQAELEEWFYGLKLSIDIHPLALGAWESALSEPTKGKIRAFYVLACLETEINWSNI